MPFDRAVAPGRVSAASTGMFIAQEAGCETAEGGMFGHVQAIEATLLVSEEAR